MEEESPFRIPPGAPSGQPPGRNIAFRVDCCRAAGAGLFPPPADYVSISHEIVREGRRSGLGQVESRPVLSPTDQPDSLAPCARRSTVPIALTTPWAIEAGHARWPCPHHDRERLARQVGPEHWIRASLQGVIRPWAQPGVEGGVGKQGSKNGDRLQAFNRRFEHQLPGTRGGERRE
jgi:hypothetical protein